MALIERYAWFVLDLGTPLQGYHYINMITGEQYQQRIDNLAKMFGGEYLDELFKHIERSYDAIFRLQGGQLHYFLDHMNKESERTYRFDNRMQLANDKLGYDCIYVLAVLTHHCQKCAVDPKAWHTRAGFCPHKKHQS